MTQTARTYRGYILDACERMYYGKKVVHIYLFDEATREPVYGMPKWFETLAEAKDAVDRRIATIAWRRKKLLDRG